MTINPMFDLKQLCEFLVKAKKSTYAAGENAKSIKESDESTSLTFTDGDWKYHDNYFGGEPFGGREVVFFQNKPIYIMTYYGSVSKEVTDLKSIYKFLQEALRLIPEDYPYRGPKQFPKNNLRYDNGFEGEIDNFSGEEKIFLDNKQVYQAKYIGGLINQRE